MLQDIQSDLVKRKESLRGDAPTGIREAVCAFANDLPDHQRPGVVFVGADDAGNPTGLSITDALLRRLADIKTDGNIGGGWGWTCRCRCSTRAGWAASCCVATSARLCCGRNRLES